MTDQVDDLKTQGAEGADAGADQGTQQQQNQAGDQTAKPWYPDDWRQKLAAGDAKIEKRLTRFTGPDGVLKWALEADRKISSGEYKNQAQLPEKPTEEQLKQYRLDNGIPETHDKYDIKVDEKLITENDKAYLESLYKYAHDNHMPKSSVEKVVNFMVASRKEAAERIAELDAEDKQTMEETLRAEMPAGEYKLNMNIMQGMFDGVNEDVKKNFLEARLPDGTKLTNDPNVVKMLVGFAREINPAATVVPNSGGANALKSVGEEIADIEKFMKSNRDEYFKDKKMQARYQELIVAQGALQKKAG